MQPAMIHSQPTPNPITSKDGSGTIRTSINQLSSSTTGILPPPTTSSSVMKTNTMLLDQNNLQDPNSMMDLSASHDSNSPEFQKQLQSSLQEFWTHAAQQIQNLQNQTEQDFKTHNDLPLARIKRIMKSDEDVRMISAEAPVLFAKACELFIIDISVRSWNYSQLHKRRTLQKEDVKEAIQKTDVFDFLVDVIQ
jgi:nuclear transcription factor Y, gamma